VTGALFDSRSKVQNRRMSSLVTEFVKQEAINTNWCSVQWIARHVHSRQSWSTSVVDRQVVGAMRWRALIQTEAICR